MAQQGEIKASQLKGAVFLLKGEEALRALHTLAALAFSRPRLSVSTDDFIKSRLPD